MRHPLRRYCYCLAERLGKHVNEILSLDSAELTEWMAYDRTKDKKWQEQYEREVELQNSRNMDNEDKAKLFRQLLGGT